MWLKPSAAFAAIISAQDPVTCGVYLARRLQHEVCMTAWPAFLFYDYDHDDDPI
jgi:hypothetical protein